ncbi:MAG TPA: helix-turn-helix domain-containing protein [Acidobacteriaceae bacterium]|nr:helix-turn-helix domain-containing protein [Acidobacteriaceae bacterium]
MATRTQEESKRPYELGRRLQQMDKSKADILRAARALLEAKGYRQLTMASLAAESGVTRQTVHNLFGTKAAVLEALFDVIALDGGMEGMREAMTQPNADAMLQRAVAVFCGFWASNRVLLRRIRGIGAVDPEFGAVLEARNQRRVMAATRIVGRFGVKGDTKQKVATLTALTSFEFFDGLVESGLDERRATATILELTRKLLGGEAARA